MYKAIIFDLDGTLLNTLEDLKNSVNYALENNGMPARSMEEIREFVGNGVANLIRRAVPKGTEEEAEQNVFADFKKHYGVHCEDFTKPYPGINELLNELRAAGIKTAVVSNKLESAVKKLCRKYFGEGISAAAGDVEGRKRKPEPDSVFAVLEEVGVDANEAVYVGDSEVDVLTAENCGMDCISVSWGFRSRETLAKAGAKVIADTVEDIKKILL
ncbi:MAG: HAD-IIIA family hydrolase [bacterium]|nr:HAD-IIIA family hydrolase [bacterium]